MAVGFIETCVESADWRAFHCLELKRHEFAGVQSRERLRSYACEGIRSYMTSEVNDHLSQHRYYWGVLPKSQT